MYLGEIRGTLCETENEKSGNGKLAIIQVFLQACSLGDKLGCLLFLHLAVLELIKLHQLEVLGSETIRYIFDHFPPKSKLRGFAIDQFRYDLQEGEFGGDAAHFISVVVSADDLGRDFLQTSVEANGCGAVQPQMHTGRDLEVSTGSEEE